MLLWFSYAALLLAWAIAGLWLAAFFWTRFCLRRQPPLQLTADEPEYAPFVTILLPARNEEKRILKTCVGSLLNQNYPNFEIIALDDRSTDMTNEILRGIASNNSRLRVVSGAELPNDWLGKPFALEQAFRQAKGDWILTTDADISFHPNALKTAVNLAAHNKLDCLTLVPHTILIGFWERLFLPIFGWFRMLAMPVHRSNDPTRKEAMGVGNFFLLRRDLLEKLGGFAVVKNEVAEDLALAETIKQNGFRFRVEYAPDLFETRMYSSLPEIWAGFTKNFFAGSGFSLGNAFSGAGSIFLFGVAPPVLAVVCFSMWLFGGQNQNFYFLVPLALVYILQTAIFRQIMREWRAFPVYAFLAPLGLALFGLILVNSTVKVLSGRGVQWKGRAIYKRGGGVSAPVTQIMEGEQ
jgi:chlorobactene glucosyltransferase